MQMPRYRVLFAVLIGVSMTFCGGSSSAEEALPLPSAAVNRLGWQLVARSGEGNAIVSPVSVWQALAMTHAGAAGETAAEIAGVLGMPDDAGAIAEASTAMRQAFEAARSEEIRLEIANRLWVQEGKPLVESFTTLLESRHAAAAGALAFATAPEAAREEINRWVADHTADRITNLLPSGSITPLTRLVLTNAVFMKAMWAEPFDAALTADEPFTLGDGTAVELPFMHRSGSMRAGQVGEGDAALTACEIPYDGGQLSMVILVPRASKPGAAATALVASLEGDWLDTLREQGGLRQRTVQLSLPKWTARKPLSLNAALAELGMPKAFEAGEADFSGMDGTRDLYVSSVVHEGFVEVSEEGTEAAAATGVVVGVRSIRPDPPLEIKADRPFVWAVIDSGTGSMLFAGVVADPRG
jgi:serpin B